jgi:hypothetical protein
MSKPLIVLLDIDNTFTLKDGTVNERLIEKLVELQKQCEKNKEYTHYTSRCEHRRMQNLKVVCNS